MIMEFLKREVAQAGYAISAASWENENHAYAFSQEAIKGTYGHPAFTAHYNKSTGQLSVTGRQPVMIIARLTWSGLRGDGVAIEGRLRCVKGQASRVRTG
jgi:hypothetical protein